MNFIFLLVVLGCVVFVIVDHSLLTHEHDEDPSIFIDTRTSIAQTDDDFICATMDYSTSNINVSLLNLDLNNRILLNAVKAFSPLKLRLGGTLQDRVIYETIGQRESCLPLVQNSSNILGFNQACLPLSRWDQLNLFVKGTGAASFFGLNALIGKAILPNGSTTGAWNSSNAESLIRYTHSKGYNIHGWELGNELSGSGVGARIAADQYASDVITLQNLVQEIYNSTQTKPLVAAPGGFFETSWFTEFLNKSAKSLQVITHHIYNLGPGEDDHIMEKILDPSYLDGISQAYKDLQTMLRNSGSSTEAWVGEAGGAYHGGHRLVTNAFVMSFWYLDQLGMAASYDTKAYCRQVLIGENYGLLDTTTFAPNPDYYSALLWHRLMGRKVLATTVSGTQKLRAYTLCAKQSEGITLLLLNFDGNKTLQVSVSTDKGPVTGPLKLPKVPTTKGCITREEYHLTAPNGDLHSQTVLLNGRVLALNSVGEIPRMNPRRLNSFGPINIDPYSFMFVHFPLVLSPACNKKCK